MNNEYQYCSKIQNVQVVVNFDCDELYSESWLIKIWFWYYRWKSCYSRRTTKFQIQGFFNKSEQNWWSFSLFGNNFNCDENYYSGPLHSELSTWSWSSFLCKSWIVKRLKETRKINQIFIHPEYTEADDNNDICVLLLEKKLPFNTIIGGIRVANADDENIYAKAGVNLTISAYGLNFLGPIMFDLLMKIQLPIYDWEECVSHFKKIDEIVTKNTFCYGGIDETRYTYDGDSGGK